VTVIIGLDLSLTSTGIVAVDEGGGIAQRRLRPKIDGIERLDFIVQTVANTTSPILGIGADLVVMEGPAFGAKGSAFH
jgi:hypothetical protein